MKKVLIALTLLAMHNSIYAQSLTIINSVPYGCGVHVDMEAISYTPPYTTPCSILGYDVLIPTGTTYYPSPAAFTPGFYDALGNTIR